MLVAAAGAGIGALSLVGLRATGAIHLQVGPQARAEQHPPPLRQLLVPHGAEGIAAVVDGKLWLSTRRGVRIEGLPVSAAGLSPHALYVGVGLGHSLVAMAPDRRLAWTRATGGPVVAVAWAPDGLRVAYVVRIGRRYALRMIEGDGDHDQLVDASVRPVRPAWRGDSLALAYVGAGGRVVVFDLGHDSRQVLTRACGAAGEVAFPAAGQRVAAAAAGGVVVAGRCVRDGGVPTALGWLGAGDLVMAGVRPDSGPMLVRVLVVRGRALAGPVACLPARVQALATWTAPNGVAVALRRGGGIEVRALTRSSQWGDCPEIRSVLLLALPHAASLTSLDVR